MFLSCEVLVEVSWTFSCCLYCIFPILCQWALCWFYRCEISHSLSWIFILLVASFDGQLMITGEISCAWLYSPHLEGGPLRPPSPMSSFSVQKQPITPFPIRPRLWPHCALTFSAYSYIHAEVTPSFPLRSMVNLFSALLAPPGSP